MTFSFTRTALTLGFAGLGAFALVNNATITEQLSNAAPVVQQVVESVSGRDVRGLYLTETNEHVADVDCNTHEVRFLSDSTFAGGPELTARIQARAEATGQAWAAGLGQVMIFNGINTVCN